MEEANENNCCSGCLICLTTTWGVVKMIICCRCRSLASLAFPEPRPVEHDREEISEDLVLSEVESDPGTPIPPRQTRVRFRSVVEVFTIVLPRSSRWRRRSTTTESIVERIVEETKVS